MKLKSLVFLLLGFVSNTFGQSVFFTQPYLQIGHQPASSSMDILWHTLDENHQWVVESRAEGQPNWHTATIPVFRTVAVTGTVAHRVYETTFTGLIPGKKFQYHILRDGLEVFIAIGQAIKTSDQAYRFVTFGDIAAMTTDQRKLALELYKAKPDMVMVTGDIVYDYGQVSDYREKFWPVYDAVQADSSGAPIMSSVPFVAAMGNHDADSRDLEKRPGALAYYYYWNQPLNGPLFPEGSALVPVLKANDAARKQFLQTAGDAYPKMAMFSFNYGNAHWTVLDSDTYVDWTDSTLLAWVKADLAAASGAVWKFVSFHHPGFSSAREHFEQQQMRLLSPLFDQYKVDIVFAGHVHNYQRSWPMHFIPDNKGTLLVGGKDLKSVRGRVVTGQWKLDKKFDGKRNTTANGVIYIVTGAGGQELYNPEQNDDRDSWQPFTTKFASTVHSLTLTEVNGKKLVMRQISAAGAEIDKIVLTKQ